jgi:hypothetical protein
VGLRPAALRRLSISAKASWSDLWNGSDEHVIVGASSDTSDRESPRTARRCDAAPMEQFAAPSLECEEPPDGP